MSDDLKIIKNCINAIRNVEDSVRDYINTGRNQRKLLEDSEKWNQICSSLDVIGDTIYSIEDYIAGEYPEKSGLRYIYTYGLLQALFIQQDAVKNLADAFNIQYKNSEKLLAIRSLRNSAIGHPTKQNENKVIYYNYISRITLSKWGFTLLRSSGDEKNEFIDVNLLDILNIQLQEINTNYSSIAAILEEADQMHLEKHRGNLLQDIFHPSDSYLFSKVFEGIHSPTYDNQSFGLAMLKSIEDMYTKFEAALLERGELHEYTKHDLDEYKHAISRVKSFLSGVDKKLNGSDARIYAFYIRENHNHFVKIAKEIDEEYSGRAR